MQPSNLLGTNTLRVRLSEESLNVLQISSLSEACSNGKSSAVIEKIINDSKRNPSLKRADSFGRNAMHYAAMKGRCSVINVLNKHGFDANTDDMYGAFPLHLAIQSKQYDAAVLLSNITEKNVLTYKRQNPILLLSKNVFNSKMNGLLAQLVQDGNDVNATDHRGCNALFYGVDKPEFVQKLIEYGIDIHHRDHFSRNALFNAVYANNITSTELLIRSGSEVDLCDDFQHTPLMLAACFGEVEIVKCLIKYGANINRTMESGSWIMCPLSFSIRHENYEVAQCLVENGANMDVTIGKNEIIWDLFVLPKYNDIQADDDDDGDCNMELEVYSLAENAGLNRNSSALFKRRTKKKQKEELLKYMIQTQTKQKLEGLRSSELIKILTIPNDILNLIASPFSWY